MTEAEIIQRFFQVPAQGISDPDLLLGIGDDAALIQIPEGQQLVVSSDSMVIAHHFVAETPAYDLAYKLVTVNVSDMAAMAATPRWMTLNLSLDSVDEAWLKAFSEGLFAAAKHYAVTLVGGDVVRSGELNLGLQIMGTVAAEKSLQRNTAQIDDDIYVTGSLGLAASAVACLKQHGNDHEKLTAAQSLALYRPNINLDFARGLVGLSHAAMDLSDGLLLDLQRLCTASQVGAVVQLEQLPLADSVDELMALTGGEDYGLLFTAPPAATKELATLADEQACVIHCIGSITKDRELSLVRDGLRQAIPTSLGFDHFK